MDFIKVKKFPSKKFPFSFSIAVNRFYNPLRLAFLWSCDAIILFTSIISAIFLFTRSAPLPVESSEFFNMMGIIALTHISIYTFLRIYDVSFRYANIYLVLKIIGIQSLLLVAHYFLLNTFFPGQWPFLCAVLQSLLATFGLLSFRFAAVLYFEVNKLRIQTGRRTLIYGAGATGKSIIKAFEQSDRDKHIPMKIVGLIDDDRKKRNKVIYGHKVLGAFHDLETVISHQNIDEMIVAIPNICGSKLKEIRDVCMRKNILIKIVPSFFEIYNATLGSVVKSLREIQLEDLLRRPRRDLDLSDIEQHFQGKCVMVTGGGGSIGYELVKQLSATDLERLVVVDFNESGLHQAKDYCHGLDLQTEFHLLDVTDQKRLDKLYHRVKPHIVFHAAAYKHVDFVELNPFYGVWNNVMGMKCAADLAHKHNVEQFIFISTDKAVRPISIMGKTKRIGELYVQSLNEGSPTLFSVVRFGNVLGSSGSLIPNVIKRIQENKPVLITDPRMTRYFMLLPEAISLILKSCLLARGGEIFILDMGKPIVITELVRELLLLYGKNPNQKVNIEYIGIRPGEKLEEELFIPGAEDQEYRDGFYIGFSSPTTLQKIEEFVNQLLTAANSENAQELSDLLSSPILTGLSEKPLQALPENQDSACVVGAL